MCLAWPAVGRIPSGGPRARGAPTGDASPGVIPLGERSGRDDLASAEIPPRDTPPDGRDDLVADRSARLGEILGALLRTGLRTDEHDLVALACVGDVGHVEHDQVHAD